MNTYTYELSEGSLRRSDGRYWHTGDPIEFVSKATHDATVKALTEERDGWRRLQKQSEVDLRMSIQTVDIVTKERNDLQAQRDALQARVKELEAEIKGLHEDDDYYRGFLLAEKAGIPLLDEDGKEKTLGVMLSELIQRRS